MKAFLLRIAMGLLICIATHLTARAEDEGFTLILDKDHTEGWRHIGKGDMIVRGGVASTVSPKGGEGGLYWYQTRSFTDFTLRLEFKADTATSNSGVLVRFPDPGSDYDTAANQGYEIRRRARSSFLQLRCAPPASCLSAEVIGMSSRLP